MKVGTDLTLAVARAARPLRRSCQRWLCSPRDVASIYRLGSRERQGGAVARVWHLMFGLLYAVSCLQRGSVMGRPIDSYPAQRSSPGRELLACAEGIAVDLEDAVLADLEVEERRVLRGLLCHLVMGRKTAGDMPGSNKQEDLC